MKLRTLVSTLAVAATALGTTPGHAAPILMCNVGITMSDGAVLRANIALPGEGEWPTILTVTGYNKDLTTRTGTCASHDATMLAAGYATIVVDDRGTGSSEGRWGIWDARTQQDYPELLDWIVAQDWSSGEIGTTGGSYLGITSLLVAATGHPAVKAVFADVPMSDAYRDVTFFGGNLDTTFMPFWFGFTQGTNANTPTQVFTGDDPQRIALNTYDHFTGGPAYVGANLVAGSIRGDREGLFIPYDTEAARFRSPGDRAHDIRAAVFYTGGWFDIFQRGEPYLFNRFTSVPEGGLKWVQSPTYHSAGPPNRWDEMGIGSKNDVKVKWFDHWMRGTDNGIEDLPPIHHWVVGADRWETHAAWPAPETDWTSYYLSPEQSGSAASLNDGTLAALAPESALSEILPFTPAGGLCNRSTTQWAAGVGSGQPCESNQRTSEAVTMTYTLPVLEQDLHIAGPLTLDLWASVDRYDTSFYVALTDVAPDGTSTQVSSGALNASHRALDESRTWRNADGDVILPWHPFTVGAQRDLVPNQPTEFQIEIYPTNWMLKAGHRLRVVIGTADTPHYTVPQDRLQKMLGGTIRILSGGRYASRLLVPVQPS